MANLLHLPSGNVLKNSLWDLVDPDEVGRLTEYGGGDYTEEDLRDRLRDSFGQDKGNLLLFRILGLTQGVSPSI
jgi:hypothetical protein